MFVCKSIWIVVYCCSELKFPGNMGDLRKLIKWISALFLATFIQQKSVNIFGVANQCAINNGDCSHFCVVTSSSHLCVCPTGFALKQDGRTCEDKIKKFFLFTDADDRSTNIISLDVNYFAAKRLFPPLGNQRPIAVDFDPVEDRVYWTDVEQGLIVNAFSNATGLKILFRCNVNVPDGIAIDKVGRNMYWSDRGTNRIEVARLDGTKRKWLIKDGLDKPRAIVLDERNGTMYWTDWGSNPKIEKAAMDGSSRRTVVTGNLGWPNGLTIDPSTNRLYWADAKLDKIEVSDLTGANRQLVVSSAGDIHPFGLTLYQGMLYWTDWNNRSISRLDLSNGNKKMIITGLKKPMDIHLYDSSVTISGSHPCATNRGLCSDLCLLKPNEGYQCACPTGITLKPDGKTCDYDIYYNKSSDHFLLLSEANTGEIYKIPLDVTDTPCEPLAIRDNISRPVAVDYDSVEGKVYWTDVILKQIVRSYPNGSDLEVLATHNVTNPDGIAIDWIGRNLYWTDAGTNRIEVSRLDGSFRTRLITANVDLPRAITLDIDARTMYWTDSGSSPKIEKSNMDGTDRTTLVSSGLTRVGSLALDFKNKLLYWCDASPNLIQRVDLQGNNRVVVLNSTSDKYHHPIGLALYQDALFWTDWGTQSVHKYNMTSAISEVFVYGMRHPMEIHMYDYNTITTGTTSCSHLNGGCSHICLPNPTGRQCFCPEGVQLKPGDQFTCQGAIRCATLPTPSNGLKTGCSDPSFQQYGTICSFSCKAGYKLTGSSRRQCLKNDSWSGMDSACQVINCTPLVPPSNGMISPSSCLSRSSYGQSCRISCQRQGYSLEGGSVRICSSDGEWTGSNDTICKDKEPPSFNNSCPGNMVIYPRKCSPYAQVVWNEPTATDNSDHVIISYPTVRPPTNLSLGVYSIHYSARDDEGNSANCSFIVQVAKKSCPPIQPPINGAITSLSCGSSIGSQASLSCNQGYRQRGSIVRSCEEDGTWSGNTTTCTAVKCAAIKRPLHGTVVPSSCKTSSGVVYKTDCFLSCNAANHYQLEGPPKISCLQNGSWSADINDVICKDIAPPEIKCPRSTMLPTEPGQSYATATWNVPVPTDNSNEPLNVSGLQPPQQFNVGNTNIRYDVTDSAGLSSSCVFSVDVRDLEAPIIDRCPGDIKTISTQRLTKLVLPGVKVTDNVGVHNFLTNIQNGSEVTFGQHNITYTASDKAGNKAYCRFRITIADSPCEDLPAPKNGGKACEVGLPGLICTVHCNPGYGFANLPHPLYICGVSGTWFHAYSPDGRRKPALPDCSKTFIPEDALFNGQYHYLTDNCSSDMTEEIVAKFKVLLLGSPFGQHLCESVPDCQNNIKVDVTCGEQTRRRRDTTASVPLTVNFAIEVPLANYTDTLLDLNDTSLQITNDILAALELAASLNISGVVIVADTTRPPEIQLASFVCGDGQVLIGTKCVNCPVGYFFNSSSCQPCAVDEYQDQEAQTSCIICPPRTSTFGQQGSKQRHDCEDLPIQKPDNKQKGMSKIKLALIIVGSALVVLLIILGIWLGRKYCRKGPNRDRSSVTFSNDAYEWEESSSKSSNA
ncbi:uncharacterized protein [Acropora muricata]|uniref:uncharacterized protein isoform X1 n=2 Tax=Acropora muricata TaxID=159855 RepID=UPI0034E46449